MRILAFVNQSTVCTDDEVARMAQAVSLQLCRDVCPAWRIPCVYSYFSKKADVPDFISPLVFFDHADQADALGYHDVDPRGLPYARVFAKEVLDAGGGIFTDPSGRNNTVSVTASHEALEIVGDPSADEYVGGPWVREGNEYALELCDAVQGDAYQINDMLVSDFLYPAYFGRGGGKLDHLNKLRKPFSVALHGYIIVRNSRTGEVNEIFGKSRRGRSPASRLEKRRRETRR